MSSFKISLAFLRDKAKKYKIRGYTKATKEELLKKVYVDGGTQTDGEFCGECEKIQQEIALGVVIKRMIDRTQGVDIDVLTGEVLGAIVETSYRS